MATLERAIQIAARAHAGQTDLARQPYILHAIRVMIAQTSREAQIVGVLHDVVEDTDVTLEILREAGFSAEIVEAIDALTRRDGEPYLAEYIPRVLRNALAIQVKKADLADNLDSSRGFFSGGSVNIPGFAGRYKRYNAAVNMIDLHLGKVRKSEALEDLRRSDDPPIDNGKHG